MSARSAVRAAAIGAALLAAAATAILLWVVTIAYIDEGGAIAVVDSVAGGLTAVCYVLVGTLIEVRRPGHRVGRLMVIAGPLYGVLALAWGASAEVEPLLDPWGVAVINLAGIAVSWAGVALIAGWIPLLFPTGSLPGPRWRLPAAIVGGLGTAGVLAGLIRPGPIVEGEPHQNPFGVAWWPPVLDLLVGAVPLLLVALVVLAIGGLATRFRSGTPVERLQVRWLLAGMAVVAGGLAGSLVEGMLRADDGYFVTAAVFTIGILLIPVTIGIAILRYRLYDIDRVVSRTLSYAVLTALLAAVFVGTNLVLQAVLVDATGGGSALTTAAATLLVAGLFQPVRRLVQAPIDRRFNRRHVDGERVVAAFTGQLRDEVDLDRIRAATVEATEHAVAPVTTGLWLRSAE